MSDQQTSYDAGDPVKVSDEEGEYYGVIIDVGEELTVQMITQDLDDKVYRITSDAYLVPRTAIAEHKPLKGSDDGAPRAFHELGFRMLDGGSFARHSDEEGAQLMPVGDEAFELLSESDSDDDSMSDFIVRDHECEPFTHADSSIDFVRETHQAVRAFQSWIPQSEQEYNAKEFIERQESRAVQIDDEIRFSRGMPGANYARPE